MIAFLVSVAGYHNKNNKCEKRKLFWSEINTFFLAVKIIFILFYFLYVLFDQFTFVQTTNNNVENIYSQCSSALYIMWTEQYSQLICNGIAFGSFPLRSNKHSCPQSMRLKIDHMCTAIRVQCPFWVSSLLSPMSGDTSKIHTDFVGIQMKLKCGGINWRESYGLVNIGSHQLLCSITGHNECSGSARYDCETFKFSFALIRTHKGHIYENCTYIYLSWMPSIQPSKHPYIIIYIHNTVITYRSYAYA